MDGFESGSGSASSGSGNGFGTGSDSDFGMGGASAPSSKATRNSGGWHFGLTGVCLLVVAALSGLMAWLTKDIGYRSPFLIGAIFTVPAAGMFLAALLVETKTSAMTPVTSRSSQYLVAVIAVIASFAVGVVCTVLYENSSMGAVMRNYEAAHPPRKEYADVVIIMDKSSSLSGEKDRKNQSAVKGWLESLEDEARVGMIVYGDDRERIPVAPLSENRSELYQRLTITPGGSTNFDEVLYQAVAMIEKSAEGRVPGLGAQIIMVTDAAGNIAPEIMNGYIQRMNSRDIVFSIVYLNNETLGADDPMLRLASQTGGTGISVSMNDLAAYYQNVSVVQEQDRAEYEKSVLESGRIDLLRTDDSAANLIVALLLGLEGLTIGLGLMLMLSVRGQKRAQPLISVFLAVMAYVILKVLGPEFMTNPAAPAELITKAGIPQWILEMTAFSLFGIVFMRKNVFGRSPASSGNASGASGGGFEVSGEF